MRALTSSLVSQFKGRLEDCRNVRWWNPTLEGMICPWSIFSYTLCFPVTSSQTALLHCVPLAMILCLTSELKITEPSNHGLKPPKLQAKLNLDYFTLMLPGKCKSNLHGYFSSPSQNADHWESREMLVKPWVKKRAFAPCRRGCEKVQPLCKSAWTFLKKLKTSCDPAISPLAYTGRESKSAYHRDVHTSVYYCVVHQGRGTKSA